MTRIRLSPKAPLSALCIALSCDRDAEPLRIDDGSTFVIRLPDLTTDEADNHALILLPTGQAAWIDPALLVRPPGLSCYSIQGPLEVHPARTTAIWTATEHVVREWELDHLDDEYAYFTASDSSAEQAIVYRTLLGHVTLQEGDGEWRDLGPQELALNLDEGAWNLFAATFFGDEASFEGLRHGERYGVFRPRKRANDISERHAQIAPLREHNPPTEARTSSFSGVPERPSTTSLDPNVSSNARNAGSSSPAPGDAINVRLSTTARPLGDERVLGNTDSPEISNSVARHKVTRAPRQASLSGSPVRDRNAPPRHTIISEFETAPTEHLQGETSRKDGQPSAAQHHTQDQERAPEKIGPERRRRALSRNNALSDTPAADLPEARENHHRLPLARPARLLSPAITHSTVPRGARGLRHVVHPMGVQGDPQVKAERVQVNAPEPHESRQRPPRFATSGTTQAVANRAPPKKNTPLPSDLPRDHLQIQRPQQEHSIHSHQRPASLPRLPLRIRRPQAHGKTTYVAAATAIELGSIDVSLGSQQKQPRPTAATTSRRNPAPEIHRSSTGSLLAQIPSGGLRGDYLWRP